jgi:hypothetical protein
MGTWRLPDTPATAKRQPLSALREVLTDAIRFWEPRRIAYNVVLALVVIAVCAFFWPQSRAALTLELAQRLFILAVLANVAYCAAYLVDVPAQLSDFAAAWRRHRWILFAVGVTFAGILTRFLAVGMFGRAAG